MPDGATRRVSLHDGDARPIAKGRLGKPVEFGYKAQVTDNDDGIILDYALEQGNPADGPQLAPAIGRVIKRTGRTPRTVTADRGYGEQPVEDDLHGLGVRHVVIPRKGKPGKARQAAEQPPRVPRALKWRTGSEGRISHPQTPLRLGPHPPGRHRRSPDLDRIRGPGPQPGQDRRPGHLTPPGPHHANPAPASPELSPPAFQVEVAKRCHIDRLRLGWRHTLPTVPGWFSAHRARPGQPHPAVEAVAAGSQPWAGGPRDRPAYIGGVSAQSPATPTLAALRRARRRQEMAMRWLRPVALGVALLVAARTFRGNPAPGWHGAGLVISVALAAMGTGAAGLLASYRSAEAAQLTFLTLFLAGSAAVFWLQPGGAGLVSALAGVGLMARWLPARMTAVPVGLTMAAIAGSAVADQAHHPVTSVLLAVAGLAAIYGVALLTPARRGQPPGRTAAGRT